MRQGTVEKGLRELYNKLQARGPPEFILVFVAFRGTGERDLVKLITDTELGVAHGIHPQQKRLQKGWES